MERYLRRVPRSKGVNEEVFAPAISRLENLEGRIRGADTAVLLRLTMACERDVLSVFDVEYIK